MLRYVPQEGFLVIRQLPGAEHLLREPNRVGGVCTEGRLNVLGHLETLGPGPKVSQVTLHKVPDLDAENLGGFVDVYELVRFCAVADETIGKRLRTGIAKEGWSIRKFWRRMEKKAKTLSCLGIRVPGVSYPSIRAFVEDKRKPTFAFLEAAADELDLNYAWLVTGIGPSSANVLEIKEFLATEEDRLLCDPLAKAFPAYRKLPPAIRGVVRMTWMDLRNHKRRIGEAVDDESDQTLAQALGRALAAPLEHLDMGTLGPLPLRQYVLGMCSAIAPLVARGNV